MTRSWNHLQLGWTVLEDWKHRANFWCDLSSENGLSIEWFISRGQAGIWAGHLDEWARAPGNALSRGACCASVSGPRVCGGTARIHRATVWSLRRHSPCSGDGLKSSDKSPDFKIAPCVARFAITHRRSLPPSCLSVVWGVCGVPRFRAAHWYSACDGI